MGQEAREEEVDFSCTRRGPRATISKYRDIVTERKFTVVSEVRDLFQQLLDMFAFRDPYKHPACGRICMIRTFSAGIHIGKVIYVQDRNVELADSRRIWSWVGAFSLSEVSQVGIEKASRVAMTVPNLWLSEAVEIIPCTADAWAKISVCTEAGA